MGWATPTIGVAGFLGAILFLAVLCSPTRAFSVTAPGTYSVKIAWDPNPESNVIGYRVYYGVASGAYTKMLDVTNATNITIPGLMEGSTYYFAVTAYNIFGLESDPSDELNYEPGLPQVRTRVTPTGLIVLVVNGRINHTYRVEGTEDFKTWTTIGNVTLGANGSFELIAPNAENHSRQFFRTLDTQP